MARRKSLDIFHAHHAIVFVSCLVPDVYLHDVLFEPRTLYLCTVCFSVGDWHLPPPSLNVGGLLLQRVRL